MVISCTNVCEPVLTRVTKTVPHGVRKVSQLAKSCVYCYARTLSKNLSHYPVSNSISIWRQIDVKFTCRNDVVNFQHGRWQQLPKYYFIISIIHPHTLEILMQSNFLWVIFITTHCRISAQHDTSTCLLLPVVDNIRFQTSCHFVIFWTKTWRWRVVEILMLKSSWENDVAMTHFL